MAATEYELICQEMLTYMLRMHFNEYEGEVTFSTPLLENGIIDSLSMMTLMLFLEQRYGLDFLATDVSRDDFKSINTIAELVSRNKSSLKTQVAS